MRQGRGLPVVLAMAVAISGCSAGAGSSPGRSSNPSPSPVASSTATQAPGPSPTRSPSASASTAGTTSPDGLLTVGAAGPLPGAKGSGCWSSGTTSRCDDTPWLVPRTGFETDAGLTCSVAFAGGIPIVAWSVAAAPVDSAEPTAEMVGLSSRDSGPPVGGVSFACPGVGDWVVTASLRADAGDQSYYWRVTVR